MRISSLQNNTSFKALELHYQGYLYHKASELSRCKEKLAKTKFIDVIIDSNGLALKDKKTDILQRIQSFSLLPLEQAVSINMIGEKEPKYKFYYPTLETARSEWDKIRESTRKCSSLEYYTKTALWIDNLLQKNTDQKNKI